MASSRGPWSFIVVLYEVVPAKLLPSASGFPCSRSSHYVHCPPATISACWWSSTAPPQQGAQCLRRGQSWHSVCTDGFYTHTCTHTRLHTHMASIQTHTHTASTYTHTHTHTQCLVASSLERESFPFVWVCLHISVHTRCNWCGFNYFS